MRGIVIGSNWRRCSASCAVTEFSIAVADYLLGQCDNFLQFAGQKDGATRLKGAHHDASDVVDDDCFYYCEK